MRELVLHIGYPKTATTSLQHGWLYPLDQMGEIAYHGKWKDLDSASPSESPRFYQDVLRDGRDLATVFDFSDDLVNIISHELLTMPRFPGVWSTEPGKTLPDPFTFPEQLVDVFSGHVDDITIWLTVRNQQTLINSAYAHYYHKVRHYPQHGSWDDYLASILARDRTVYDVGALLEAYEAVFNRTNIDVLFFEKLLNDSSAYAHDVADTIGIDHETLTDIARIETHENTKPTTDTTRIKYDLQSKALHDVIVNTPVLHSAKDMVKRLLGKQRFETLVHPLWFTSYDIDRPTDDQRERIYERFAATNKRLTEFGVDRKLLTTYNYV